MLSTKTKAKTGAKGAKGASAAKPTMKVGLRLKSRQAKTKTTAKDRVLPALAIGLGIVAVIVLLEFGWARSRKAAEEQPEGVEPEIVSASEPETPGAPPAAGTPE